MIVALDAQLRLGTATGIGEYVAGLAQALRESGTGVVELQEPKLDPWRFDRRLLWDQILLPRRARACGADLLHCASGTMPNRVAMPVVVTVHDVAWLRVQKHAKPYARWYFGAFMLKRYRTAAAIVVDSEFSRGELLTCSGLAAGRVHVVYPGVSKDFYDLQRAPRPETVVLVPGTVEPRKNIEVLIRAMARVPRARLVSVGPFTDYRDECERLARRAGVTDRVEFRGYVSRAQLLQLYATCALVAVPSTYEGFGYAAAQALCVGTPLLASDATSLPEVVRGCAHLLPEHDDEAWAREIERILSDPQSANERAGGVRVSSQERFAWSSSAREIDRIYRSVF